MIDVLKPLPPTLLLPPWLVAPSFQHRAEPRRGDGGGLHSLYSKLRPMSRLNRKNVALRSGQLLVRTGEWDGTHLKSSHDSCRVKLKQSKALLIRRYYRKSVHLTHGNRGAAAGSVNTDLRWVCQSKTRTPVLSSGNKRERAAKLHGICRRGRFFRWIWKCQVTRTAINL